MYAAAHSCFHCDLPVIAGANYSVVIFGEARAMCCPGCEAVAKAIVGNGLSEFYQYRTQHNNPTEVLPQDVITLKLYDNASIQNKFIYSNKENDSDRANIKKISLMLEGIACAACVWLSEHHVRRLSGVTQFQMNYSNHRAQLEWDDTKIKLSHIMSAIRDIGYTAHPVDQNRQEKIFKKERSQAIRRLAVAGLGAMQVMMLAVALYAGDYDGMDSYVERFLRWVSLFITTPVLIYSAQPFFLAAKRDLKMGGLGMDVPVVLAISAAYIASAWATITNTGEIYFDSVTMFSFFLLTGRFLEMLARQKAARTAEDLVKFIPAMATRLDGNNQLLVAVSDLRVGDIILVKPGESIPADGIILSNQASVDESLLTGESLPVTYHTNDQVIAGSVNVESVMRLRVSALGEDTVLASIQRLLERAQTEKPKLAILADKVASYFVLALLLITMSIGIIWFLIDSDRAFWIVISVLVVTCPCALSLATPTALTVAIGRLTKLGMLTTRGNALENLAKVSHVVFDKTGTLTEGRLELTHISCFSDLSEEQCLQLACSIEQYSEHPVGKSLLKNYSNRDCNADLLSVTDVINKPGEGMQAVINKKKYFIGRADYIMNIMSFIQDDMSLKNTRVLLADEKKILAGFEFDDPLRGSAKKIIQKLKNLGLETMILSGDHETSVSSVAKQLGITNAFSELTPSTKLEKLTELQERGAVVAMVGDGINDAPVLSKAQVSIAMGQASYIAHASADMILLSNDLTHIADSLCLSKATRRIIKQNLLWALLYNLVALPLAATGWLAPWMAAIGMSASSLIVVLNALRLTTLKTSGREATLQ